MSALVEVASFDASGVTAASVVGRRVFGSPFSTTVRSSAAGPSGEIAFFGEFGGALELGTSVLATQGDASMRDYVMLVDPK